MIDAPTEATGPTPGVPAPPRARREPRRPGGMPWRLATALIPPLLAGGLALLAWKHPGEARKIWEAVAGKPAHRVVEAPVPPDRPEPPWDGTIRLEDRARRAMGFATAPVRDQVEPIKLELLGTTDYITDTLTKIRPMFKGRVDKVHVGVGGAVKKGDPLVDLYSKDLAEAKSLFEVARIQWAHDKWLLDAREPLMRSQAITQMVFEETKNGEMKSRKEFEVARDKLSVYGLTDREVEEVAEQGGSRKARMTLRAPTDGYVIDRDVVPGNLYDENDTLLVIAPLDRLWVWGNVFESDLDLVKLGQAWDIRFPFLRYKLRGRVEYVSNRVDPNTHAVRIRTSIPNAEGRLKSDMLVRGMLSIPPTPGRTVIPRAALIVDDGRYTAFVRKAGTTDRFERRAVGVAQEKDDLAVIDHGLAAGEDVVSAGGLILAQIYEDLSATHAGSRPPTEGRDAE